MQSLRVFLSSTCYDLQRERTAIKNLLRNLGHTPILSNENNIRYDPDVNTHDSCLEEVEKGTDYMIMIISKRFGGSIFRTTFEKHIKASEIAVKSRYVNYFRSNFKYSISHCEYFKALELNIPILVFISKEVSDARNRYMKAKANNNGLKRFKGLGIKNEYDIYEFISFINNLRKGNGTIEYKQIQEIKTHIQQALSNHFKNLLTERIKKSTSAGIELLPTDHTKFSRRLIEKLSADYRRQKAHLEVENQLVFDENCNCNYYLNIKISPKTPYYFYYFQIYPDKLGEIIIKKLRNVDSQSDERHIGIIEGKTAHIFLFNSPRNYNKPFTIELSLFVENYLSDLLTEGKGNLLKQLHDENKKYTRIIHEMRFPQNAFKNLQVICKQIPDNARLNKPLVPTVKRGQKIYFLELAHKQLVKEKDPVIRLEFTQKK